MKCPKADIARRRPRYCLPNSVLLSLNTARHKFLCLFLEFSRTLWVASLPCYSNLQTLRATCNYRKKFFNKIRQTSTQIRCDLFLHRLHRQPCRLVDVYDAVEMIPYHWSFWYPPSQHFQCFLFFCYWLCTVKLPRRFGFKLSFLFSIKNLRFSLKAKKFSKFYSEDERPNDKKLSLNIKRKFGSFTWEWWLECIDLLKIEKVCE